MTIFLNGDADGLLAELALGVRALDVVVADSDDLILSLPDGSGLPAQLAIGHRGLRGALEPWQRLLVLGQSVEEIRSWASTSVLGRVSRAWPVQTAVRNCTRDEGGPFGFGDQVADPKPP